MRLKEVHTAPFRVMLFCENPYLARTDSRPKAYYAKNQCTLLVLLITLSIYTLLVLFNSIEQ